MSTPFVGFPKIPRLSREIVITEKIDGTNAQVFIWDENHRPRKNDGTLGNSVGLRPNDIPWIQEYKSVSIASGSKKQWITPTNDNYGFAKWVFDNAENLAVMLGHGRHFGEWWGQGIQRNYGLKGKRFSLFNVKKWGDDSVRPACCHVVPVLFEGLFDTNSIEHILTTLAIHGSRAAPGFMNPEGIIVYHTAGNLMFKKTVLNDEKRKGDET